MKHPQTTHIWPRAKNQNHKSTYITRNYFYMSKLPYDILIHNFKTIIDMIYPFLFFWFVDSLTQFLPNTF